MADNNWAKQFIGYNPNATAARQHTVENKYDNYLLPGIDQNESRARQQGWGAELGNGLGRAVTKMIPNIIGNAAAIVDLEDYFNQDDEVGNFVTAKMQELGSQIDDFFPIYEKNPGESLSFDDSAWWMKNMSQVLGSGLEFAITGAGLASATGKVLQMVGATGKVGQGINLSTNVLALNQAEALLSAQDVYKNAYELNKKKGLPDDQAKQLAADAAAYTININRLNMPLNLTSSMLFLRTPQATRALVDKMGKTATLKRLGLEGLQEYGEESINHIAEQEGNRKAEGKKYSIKNTLSDILSAEGIEAGLLGFLGGVAQTGFTVGVNEVTGVNKEERTRYQQQKALLDEYETYRTAQPGQSKFDEVVENILVTNAYQAKIYDADLKNNTGDADRLRNQHLQYMALTAFKNGTTGKLVETLDSIINTPGAIDKYGKESIEKYTKARQQIEKWENKYNSLIGRVEDNKREHLFNNTINADRLLEEGNDLDNKVTTLSGLIKSKKASGLPTVTEEAELAPMVIRQEEIKQEKLNLLADAIEIQSPKFDETEYKKRKLEELTGQKFEEPKAPEVKPTETPVTPTPEVQATPEAAPVVKPVEAEKEVKEQVKANIDKTTLTAKDVYLNLGDIKGMYKIKNGVVTFLGTLNNKGETIDDKPKRDAAVAAAQAHVDFLNSLDGDQLKAIIDSGKTGLNLSDLKKAPEVKKESTGLDSLIGKKFTKEGSTATYEVTAITQHKDKNHIQWLRDGVGKGNWPESQYNEFIKDGVLKEISPEKEAPKKEEKKHTLALKGKKYSRKGSEDTYVITDVVTKSGHATIKWINGSKKGHWTGIQFDAFLADGTLKELTVTSADSLFDKEEDNSLGKEEQDVVDAINDINKELSGLLSELETATDPISIRQRFNKLLSRIEGVKFGLLSNQFLASKNNSLKLQVEEALSKLEGEQQKVEENLVDEVHTLEQDLSDAERTGEENYKSHTAFRTTNPMYEEALKDPKNNVEVIVWQEFVNRVKDWSKYKLKVLTKKDPEYSTLKAKGQNDDDGVTVVLTDLAGNYIYPESKGIDLGKPTATGFKLIDDVLVPSESPMEEIFDIYEKDGETYFRVRQDEGNEAIKRFLNIGVEDYSAVDLSSKDAINKVKGLVGKLQKSGKGWKIINKLTSSEAQPKPLVSVLLVNRIFKNGEESVSDKHFAKKNNIPLDDTKRISEEFEKMWEEHAKFRERLLAGEIKTLDINGMGRGVPVREDEFYPLEGRIDYGPDAKFEIESGDYDPVTKSKTTYRYRPEYNATLRAGVMYAIVDGDPVALQGRPLNPTEINEIMSQLEGLSGDATKNKEIEQAIKRLIYVATPMTDTGKPRNITDKTLYIKGNTVYYGNSKVDITSKTPKHKLDELRTFLTTRRRNADVRMLNHPDSSIRAQYRKSLFEGKDPAFKTNMLKKGELNRVNNYFTYKHEESKPITPIPAPTGTPKTVPSLPGTVKKERPVKKEPVVETPEVKGTTSLLTPKENKELGNRSKAFGVTHKLFQKKLINKSLDKTEVQKIVQQGLDKGINTLEEMIDYVSKTIC